MLFEEGDAAVKGDQENRSGHYGGEGLVSLVESSVTVHALSSSE